MVLHTVCLKILQLMAACFSFDSLNIIKIYNVNISVKRFDYATNCHESILFNCNDRGGPKGPATHLISRDLGTSHRVCVITTNNN